VILVDTGPLVAASVLREAGIVHVYAQETAADRAAVADLYGLPGEVVALLGTLPRGSSIVRIGEREPLRLVDHLRAAVEVPMTDTDAAMLGRPAAAPARPGDEPAAAVPVGPDPPRTGDNASNTSNGPNGPNGTVNSSGGAR
jgi:hypothetical protein